VRAIPDPGFAGDDGAVPPELAAALVAYAADPTLRSRTMSVLQHARLLVPVVAVPGEESADMATVLIRRPDGRTALLGFTGADPLRRWNPEARPVPVPARRAAQAALQEGADTLLVDAAGPTTFVVDGEDLAALTSGHTLVEVSGRFGWARLAR
jgi:hypothetical protein